MSSTVKNLLFMETLLEKYLHIHETVNNTLYVTRKGTRMPYKKTLDNLEENMKFVEGQLEQALHEHEVATKTEETISNVVIDDEADLTTDPILGSGDTLPTTDDVYFWSNSSSAASISQANPKNGANHVRLATSGFDVADIFPIDPSLGDTNKPIIAAVSPNDEISASVWAAQSSGSQDMVMELQWYDASLNQIQTNDLTLATLTASYQLFESGTWTAPANTAFLGLQWSGGRPGTANTDFDTFTLNLTTEEESPLTLFTNHKGFRFPYDWKSEQQIALNMDHLETQMTKFLHKHEVTS